MIPVARVPEPEGFDARVRQRGRAWLDGHPEGMRPEPYWSEFLPQLREGFVRRCGYSAMLVPEGGTVDHLRSRRDHRALLYEWSNLRFASATMNASKKAAEVLDPYDVGAGWFEVLIPSMELVARYERIPPGLRPLVEETLRVLPIVHDERIVRQRREWYVMFRGGELSLAGLHRVAPQIADAVERWHHDHPGQDLPGALT